MNNRNETVRKIGVLAAVIVPFLGLIAAIILSWGKGIDFVSLSLFGGFSVLTILGVTIGFHRLLTHKSFETYTSVKFTFLVSGAMAVEGRVKEWVAEHRRHHADPDGEEDPHSPMKGFIHAHLGWMLARPKSDQDRLIPDLLRDRAVAFVDRHFGLWVALSLLLPATIGWALTGTFQGALRGFLWGGLARICFVHHTTWSINSICHIFGSQPFPSKDNSRNNVILGFIALGEGWHHNHHVFERSAKHGLFWWQLDVSYLIIRALELCGLAWNVKVPSEKDIKAKLASA